MTNLLRVGARGLFEFIQTAVIAGAIFVVVYLLLFQPHKVKGNSMLPNFHEGEYILTEKITYRFDKPQRGDIVVFKSPRSERIDFIKRIIALPGENLALRNGKFYINGRLLVEPYLANNNLSPGGAFLGEGDQIPLPPEHYFVAGDNRAASSDSREWGVVAKTNLVGRAFLRYWPPGKFGLLPDADSEVTF